MTPITYESRGADIYDDEGAYVATCDTRVDGGGLDIATERAEEIARRWNAHDALVAVCDKASDLLIASDIENVVPAHDTDARDRTVLVVDDPHYGEALSVALKRAREALARASAPLGREGAK